MSKNLKLEDVNIVGKGERKHLKLTLKCSNAKWTALFWGEGERLEEIRKLASVDVVYTIKRNCYNGNITPQMIVLDLKRST